ncbi:MAG: hypothetical protein ACQGVK_22965 [Myxococcota bacterium]
MPVRRGIAAALAISGALLVAGAERLPDLDQGEALARVDRVLARDRTYEHLKARIGHAPERCVPSDADHRLCQWIVSAGGPAWQELADALETDRHLNLLCELPMSSGERSPGSCSAHPRKSNRFRWHVPSNKGPRRANPASIREAKARNREHASAAMARARDLVALCRLMGAVPDQCSQVDQTLQVCTWRTTSRTWGHGTLAAFIEAPRDKKIRLHCELPLDGRPRDADSCRAEIGS